jgi:hypothetical protein
MTQNMKLGSQMWTADDAECVATIFTFRNGHRWNGGEVVHSVWLRRLRRA